MSMKPESRESIRHDGPSAAASGGAIEPWFTILVSALVPLGAGLFAPDSWRTALHVLGGAMCAGGLILLVRHEMTVRRQRNVTDR